MSESTIDLKFHHPFSCVVNGPSGCGKTEWIQMLLHHADAVIENIPEKIIWCYNQWQPAYSTIQGVEFIEGLRGLDALSGRSHLVILDDLMMEADKSVMDLFVRGRHRNISVIFVTHNIFYKTPALRTIKLNSNYMTLFKNPCDTSQILSLGRQIFPGSSKHLEEAFKDATQKQYGYLFLDLRPHTHDNHRLRTNIFPGEEQAVYYPK